MKGVSGVTPNTVKHISGSSRLPRVPVPTDPSYNSVIATDGYFNNIYEKTADHGVIIDNNVLIKDGLVTMFSAITDTVNERTVDNGVVVDKIRLREDTLVSPSMTLASISAVGATTDISLGLIPKGTGAILANIPDNAGSGGNVRGNYALDLQRTRQFSSQVASGNRAVITGGERNLASGENTFIGSGYKNSALGYASCVAGGVGNTADGESGVVAGGSSNTLYPYSDYSGILAGNLNTVTGSGSGVLAGFNNDIVANSAAVVAGNNNNITNANTNSIIGAGSNNNINSAGSSNGIVCGTSNQINGTATNSNILCGSGNNASGFRSTILGGQTNTVNGSDCLVFGTNCQATSNGTVILADDQLTSFANTLTNQFNARFSNGYRLTGGNVTIDGSVIINGALTTINSDQLNVKDRYIMLNNGMTSGSASSGIIANGDVLSNYTVTGNFVAGVATVSNPRVGLTVATGLSVGNFIQISGSVSNNGMYEVLSHTGGILTIRGIGLTAAVEPWSQKQFTAEVVPASCYCSWVNLAVWRYDSTNSFQLASGFNSGLSFSKIPIPSSSIDSINMTLGTDTGAITINYDVLSNNINMRLGAFSITTTAVRSGPIVSSGVLAKYNTGREVVGTVLLSINSVWEECFLRLGIDGYLKIYRKTGGSFPSGIVVSHGGNFLDSTPFRASLSYISF